MCLLFAFIYRPVMTSKLDTDTDLHGHGWLLCSSEGGGMGQPHEEVASHDFWLWNQLIQVSDAELCNLWRSSLLKPQFPHLSNEGS